MKKYALVSTLLFHLFASQAQEITYTPLQIKTDISYLQAALAKNQPNLYLYTAKQDLNLFFDSLRQQMTENLDEVGFYRHVTPVCSKIKDGHTYFQLSAKALASNNDRPVFLPFKMYWNGEKLYIELNYLPRDTIENGTAITSINDIPAEQIIQYCLHRMSRDGNDVNYPVWVLNSWFSEYYSYFFGQSTYAVKYLTPQGVEQTTIVQALTKKEMLHNRAMRYPDRSFTQSFDVKSGDGITLVLHPEHKTAILTIKSFDRKILQKAYRQNFKKTIRQYVRTLEEAGVTNLILDIRNNQGGKLSYGKYLLSYLLNEPFKVLDGYARVKKADESSEDKRNRNSKGAATHIFKPRAKAFKGALYVLTNGGSFSCSGIVSSALQYYKRGTLIGEETGGNRCVISANKKTITLPNTRIQVDIPCRQFNIREKSKNTGHGVVPDYTVKPSIYDLISGKDAVLDYTLQMIRP